MNNWIPGKFSEYKYMTVKKEQIFVPPLSTPRHLVSGISTQIMRGNGALCLVVWPKKSVQDLSELTTKLEKAEIPFVDEDKRIEIISNKQGMEKALDIINEVYPIDQNNLKKMKENFGIGTINAKKAISHLYKTETFQTALEKALEYNKDGYKDVIWHLVELCSENKDMLGVYYASLQLEGSAHSSFLYEFSNQIWMNKAYYDDCFPRPRDRLKAAFRIGCRSGNDANSSQLRDRIFHELCTFEGIGPVTISNVPENNIEFSLQVSDELYKKNEEIALSIKEQNKENDRSPINSSFGSNTENVFFPEPLGYIRDEDEEKQEILVTPGYNNDVISGSPGMRNQFQPVLGMVFPKVLSFFRAATQAISSDTKDVNQSNVQSGPINEGQQSEGKSPCLVM